MTVGLLLFIAFASLGAGILAGLRLPRVWLLLTVTATVAGLAAALVVLLGAQDWEWRSGFMICGEFASLRLDGVSALFAALLCVVGGTGAVYAHSYWPDHLWRKPI